MHAGGQKSNRQPVSLIHDEDLYTVVTVAKLLNYLYGAEYKYFISKIFFSNVLNPLWGKEEERGRGGGRGGGSGGENREQQAKPLEVQRCTELGLHT